MASMFSNSQIDLASLPKVEDLDFTPIAKRYFNVILINLLIVYSSCIGLLFILKIFVTKALFHKVFWYIIIVLVLFFIAQLILSKLEFKTRQYALREKDISYTYGYINNTTVTIPFNRIQHLEISTSFLARKFNLATLKMYSAGESGGDLAIKGLPKEIADAQFAFLTNLLNERE